MRYFSMTVSNRSSEKFRNQKSKHGIADAVRYEQLVVRRIERQTRWMQQPTERAADDRPRRHVALIGDVPNTDETKLRIEPRVLGNLGISRLQCDARINVGMQVV